MYNMRRFPNKRISWRLIKCIENITCHLNNERFRCFHYERKKKTFQWQSFCFQKLKKGNCIWKCIFISCFRFHNNANHNDRILAQCQSNWMKNFLNKILEIQLNPFTRNWNQWIENENRRNSDLGTRIKAHNAREMANKTKQNEVESKLQRHKEKKNWIKWKNKISMKNK